MKYFNKPQMNHAFCITIRLNFRKTGKNSIPKTLIGRECTAIFCLQRLWQQMLGLAFSIHNRKTNDIVFKKINNF